MRLIILLFSFPPSSHPVLAFRGAPASYPVEEQNRHAHAFLKWSEKINKEVDECIQNTLPKGPFVGIHLRNGIDWVKNVLFVKMIILPEIKDLFKLHPI